MKSPRSSVVPKSMQTTYDAVVALTDAFCRDHLNDEYRDLARAMTAALCRKRPSPLASGQPRTWACGIIHALGRLNFLSDKASQPYMTMAEVSAAFGVGESTASAKARAISDALHTNRMDPTWMLKSIVDQNPFGWMAEVKFRQIRDSSWGTDQPPHSSEGRLSTQNGGRTPNDREAMTLLRDAGALSTARP